MSLQTSAKQTLCEYMQGRGPPSPKGDSQGSVHSRQHLGGDRKDGKCGTGEMTLWTRLLCRVRTEVRKEGKMGRGTSSALSEAERKGSLALAEVGTAQMLGLRDMEAEH